MIVPTHKMLAFDVLHVSCITHMYGTHTQTCTHGHVAQTLKCWELHTHHHTHTRIHIHTHCHKHTAPSAIVQITDSGRPLTPGQSYSITCELTGVNGSITPSTYQWKTDGTLVSTEQTLSFSPLRLTDAGRYTCQVSLFGMVFSGAKDIRIPS